MNIIHEGHAIECIGNPAQKTQFRIWFKNPDTKRIDVTVIDFDTKNGRKFSNWADVINASLATNAAIRWSNSRIVRIETYNDLYFERDQLEKVSDFEKVAGVILAGLVIATIYAIFTTMWDYVPTGFMG